MITAGGSLNLTCYRNPIPGDIYYQDGTISESILTDKTAVGIVVRFASDKGFVIGLDESKDCIVKASREASCFPSTEEKTIPYALFNCGSDDQVVNVHTYFSGKELSACLLTKDAYFPPVEYCHQYAPAGNDSGLWFLPSYQEAKYVYASLNAVNSKLNAMGLTPFARHKNTSDTYYWSSTEIVSKGSSGYTNWWAVAYGYGYGTTAHNYNANRGQSDQSFRCFREF